MSTNNKATLFLVATPIGNLNEISKRALDVLNNVAVVACEDTRNSRKLMSFFDIHTKLITYHNFNEEPSTKGILEILGRGEDVALISDAGYPLISDPGYLLVNSVINEGYNIQTISGPNAGLNALVASGLETTHYMFYGFLNAKQSVAKKELQELVNFPYTIIFYEAPHRITKTLKLCLEILGDRKAVIARELTKVHEEYIRGSLSELLDREEYKGEIVLLVEGKKKEEISIDINSLIDKVDGLAKEGYSTKEAISKVAKENKVSKNELYELYHRK